MARVSRQRAGRASWPATLVVVVLVVVTMTVQPLAATTPHTHLHLCSPAQREPAGSVPTSGTAVASSRLIPWIHRRYWHSDWPADTRAHISTQTYIALAGIRGRGKYMLRTFQSRREEKKKKRPINCSWLARQVFKVLTRTPVESHKYNCTWVSVRSKI